MNPTHSPRLHLVLAGLILAGLRPAAAVTEAAPHPVLAFTPAAKGEFTFDTGVLRGRLRADGKSLGLSSVAHTPTGRRLDRGNGLMSHYRVFTQGVRYGPGAWDWPSTARLQADGSVEVHWPAAANRPFVMEAVYRWSEPMRLELETRVKPEVTLRGFESFLASYFDEAFTNALAWVRETEPGRGSPGLLAARPSFGDWLMFPRGSDVVPLIQDGRWQLEPNPVDWVIMPVLEKPVGVRRDRQSGVTAILGASAQDCFAVAMPHQTESHYSVYLSLFGRDLPAGEVARARAWLVVAPTPEGQLLELCTRAAR
jgi:hypothetical protein